MDAVNKSTMDLGLFSGLEGPLRALFAFENYFLSSFLLNAAAAAVYLYSFIHAANKNL